MWQQKSYEYTNVGTLYLIPTPIGNLEDITFRAVRMLKEVDLIAAEDTRQTRKLLNHFAIDAKLVSYHEHNKVQSGKKLIEELLAGKSIGLVSDAGMPAISDPGYELVVECLSQRIPVVPLPGANAALTSFIASGLPTNHFCFYGFLPREKKERRAELEELKKNRYPTIFYESPHRFSETVKAIYDVFGERKMVVCRELTKRYEEFIRGDISEIIEWCDTANIKGEFCLIVEGANESFVDEEGNWWENLSIEEHVAHYMNEGISSKEAIKKVAKDRQMAKRDVYSAYHQTNER